MHPRIHAAATPGKPAAIMAGSGETLSYAGTLHICDEAGPALAEELIAHCRAHLSGIKCPRSIDFDPALPRHETGKLYKRLIRDRYWEGHATRIV